MANPKQTSHTLPSSPDFQFTISLPPPTASADELFCNGHLLPLRLSPPTTMPRTHLINPHAPTVISNHKKALITQQFSFNRFSSKEQKPDSSTVTTLKDKIRKYIKKLSQFHGRKTTPHSMVKNEDVISYSFTGNTRFFRKTSCVSSCPSTMPSSPNHCRKAGVVKGYTSRSSSSSEDLQNAIEGAIAHCKNSMTR